MAARAVRFACFLILHGLLFDSEELTWRRSRRVDAQVCVWCGKKAGSDPAD